MHELPRSTTLRFDEPAEEWTDALPLGNGRLGVMVFGGVGSDRLQINDGTAWSGSPASELLEPRVTAAAAAAAIEEARAAIDSEDFAAAIAPLQTLQHRHSQSYLPFADLFVEMSMGDEPIAGYERRLELATAEHFVTFSLGGFSVERRVSVSHPDGVAMVDIRTDRPEGIDLAVILDSPLTVVSRKALALSAELGLRLPAAVAPPVDGFDEPVEYSDDPDRSLVGGVAVRWAHDGSNQNEEGMRARGVRHATIVFTTDTSFSSLGAEPQGSAQDVVARASARVAKALAQPLERLRDRQRADHAELFDRAELSVAARPGAPEAALVGLLYNYGRYLLICSSRPGGVPANLQGIWNDQLQPMWSSNYTTNINLEMNYWPAEVSALPECAEPLFDLIEALARTGRETARRIYDAPGWVVHHNTDVWGYSQPVGWGRHNPRWSFWPLGGAWLCNHLAEHLAFGADDDFLRRAFPLMRSASEFFLAWLVERADGSLATVPSTSPENEFLDADGKPVPADWSSGLDLALIADLFRNLDQVAARLAQSDDDVVAAARSALDRLPAPVIDEDGLVSEWNRPHEQAEPHHRHVSHLWFAYPGRSALSAELKAAVSASLDDRGDESTGWSLAWKLALRARLGQAEKVEDLIRLVVRDADESRGEFGGGLYPNLFSAHPPFQIDGNLGFVSGITEAIVQSHDARITLLPAVPSLIGRGHLRGAIARPGIGVDLSWDADEDGMIVPTSLTLTALHDGARGEHTVVFDRESMVVALPDRGPVAVPLERLLRASSRRLPAPATPDPLGADGNE